MSKYSTKIPAIMQQHYHAITGLTDDFCRNKLNEEYQQLARYAIAALCRKKPSPLLSGNIDTWAAAILHALGTINFLFDRSNNPCITPSKIADAFNLAKSTISNKSKQIREMLKMRPFHHHWMLPSKIDDSSLTWMISFNGFILDARTLPREIQEVAYEKGVIPYVYADKFTEMA